MFPLFQSIDCSGQVLTITVPSLSLTVSLILFLFAFLSLFYLSLFLPNPILVNT